MKILSLNKLPHMQYGFARFLASFALTAFIILISGCTDNSSISTNPATGPSKAQVRTFTGISGNRVNGSSILGKTPQIMDVHSVADSLVITRARIVISSLKLHQLGV